jgi:hypothetical protein
LISSSREIFSSKSNNNESKLKNSIKIECNENKINHPEVKNFHRAVLLNGNNNYNNSFNLIKSNIINKSHIGMKNKGVLDLEKEDNDIDEEIIDLDKEDENNNIRSDTDSDSFDIVMLNFPQLPFLEKIKRKIYDINYKDLKIQDEKKTGEIIHSNAQSNQSVFLFNLLNFSNKILFFFFRQRLR